ncbi:hypothetical protein EV702DRAFT_1178491 [Suillus placidus]|uniref:Xylanolytic transcriptional activator regulatory domain-containing protein n=1 Tax=Suillus placidus TaxID=48579 RepID=A0A9P6ZYW5_9AGAM|nr:hypothetical protein EV702DRAFT_1178491 [Suillus placidus]
MVKITSSASETSSLKRRKTEDDDGDHIHAKKPRSRVSFSCGECHRREQKSSYCIARKVPELCKALTPGKTDQDLSVRLARLEHIIEQALPQYFNSPSHPDDDNHSMTDEQDPRGSTFHSGKWYGNHSASGILFSDILFTSWQMSSLPVQIKNSGIRLIPPLIQHGTGHGDHKSALATPSIIESVRQDSEPSAADNLKSLVQECGVSPHKISELLQELPPQQFSDVLIDHYFAAINWMRYPICKADFRTAYASLCANGLGANTNNARFLPLLFVVLAISVRVTSLRYYWSSRRSLLISTAIQPDSLDIVLTRLLSARFLTFDCRITECWSQLGAAVRTAQALGFHHDAAPTVSSQISYWSYADRSYALVLGRPHAIQDDYTCTLPPLNIDVDFSPATIRNPPPLLSPTLMTFKVKSPSHYSDVLALDDDLLKFVSNLPPHFSLDPDTSLDKTKQFIPVHRFLLITEVLFVCVGLHHPYLLRKLSCDRYLRSRRACFESLIKDFQVCKAFHCDSMPKETRDSLSNAYREFQTAMISGIYLVLHPKGKDADMMQTILDGFLADHEGVREMDETTWRELKTIEFLKSRASQVAESASHGVDGASSPTNGHTGEQHSTIFSMPTSHSALPPSIRQAFTMGTMSLRTLSPTMSSPVVYALLPPYTHSPAMQHLQHNGSNDGTGTLGSPAGSGSPRGEEESAAQSLLDHWCSTFGGGPAVDVTAGMPALSWGGPGGAELSGWIGPNNNPMAGDPGLMEVDGSDWSYWEALVNQIKAGPQL